MSAVCASPADYLALRAANDNHIVSRPTQNRNSPSFQRVTIGNATADSRTDYVSGPNGALARIKKTAGLDTVTFIHADHLGTARAGTALGGALVFEDFHTPFGESLIHPDATDDQGDYTGHIRDKATGLSYMQARYQDPLIGRFLSIDPVGFLSSGGNPGYFNRYAYTMNDPVNAVDPDGREIAVLYGNTPEFKKQVATVIFKAILTGNADAFVTAHESSEMVWITEGSNHQTNYSPSGNTIYFDPTSGLELPSGEVQSPALGLIHEVGHAASDVTDSAQHQIDGQTPDPANVFTNIEERDVVTNVETPAANSFGEATRNHNAGTPVRVECVTCTEKIGD